MEAASHIGGMNKKTEARAQAAETLLRTMRAELAELPCGKWDRFGAAIEGTSGMPIMDVEVQCGSYCMGGTATAEITEPAESFLLNSGDRTRLMLTALESVLALHRGVPVRDEDGEPVGGLCCEECSEEDGFSGERVHQSYPCRTVTEIHLALNREQTRMQLRAEVEADVAAIKGSI